MEILKVLLILVCTCSGLLFNVIDGELLPETVPSRLTVSKNPVMPNYEGSVKDCPFTYYRYAKRGLASSIFYDRYVDKTYAHLVKLDTENKSCFGVIVSPTFVLTTKQCTTNGVESISFHNSSVPSVASEQIITHPDLDVALVRLKTSLKVSETVLPACFWSADTSDGFHKLRHFSRDASSGNFTYDEITCTLAERKECFISALKKNGLIQVDATSNYRAHPFVLAFGSGSVADGLLPAAAQYINWIEAQTGTSLDAIACAVSYHKKREYEKNVISSRDERMESIQLQNGIVETTTNNDHKVLIGHYVEDPTKDTLVTYDCYGVLIHDHYVVTAASCIYAARKESFLVRLNQQHQYVLSTDESYLLTEQNQYREEANVARVHIHPQFQMSPAQNDIAVLQLHGANFSFNSYFKPACLWTHDQVKVNQFETNGHGPKSTMELYEADPAILLQDNRQTELYIRAELIEDCPLSLAANQICVGRNETLVPGSCMVCVAIK